MKNAFTSIIQTRSQREKHTLLQNSCKTLKYNMSSQTTEDNTNTCQHLMVFEDMRNDICELVKGQKQLFNMFQAIIPVNTQSANFISNAYAPIVNQSVAVQCDYSTFLDKTHQYEEIIKEMKTTIEVLEEYNSSLKNELIETSTRWTYPEKIMRGRKDSWSKFQDSSFSIKTQNRYELLSTYDHKTTNPINEPQIHKLNEQSNNTLKEQSIHKHSYSNPRVIKKAASRKEITESPLKKADKKDTYNYKCINLYADSHGRGISKILRTNMTNSLIESIVKPNAILNDIIPEKKKCNDKNGREIKIFNPNQYTLIIAGTNDVDRGRGRKLYQNFKHFINNNKDSNKLIITTLLTRHDLPHDHLINTNSAKINSSLLKLNEEGRVGVIDVSLMKRNCFTMHGLHLNGRGKHKLSEMIVEKMHKMESMTSSVAFGHSQLRCREQLKSYAKALQPTSQSKDHPEEDAIHPEYHRRRRSLPPSFRGPKQPFLLTTQNILYKKR